MPKKKNAKPEQQVVYLGDLQFKDLFNVCVCRDCGTLFAIPTNLYVMREARAARMTCPNGHRDALGFYRRQPKAFEEGETLRLAQ